METQIAELLQGTQSAENNARIQAEIALSKLFESDPSSAAVGFIQFASNTSLEASFRQSCLLYLKRAVPAYWSAAFPSFRGPAINSDSKAAIRNSLVQLISNDPNSKIRNSAVYCTVQIAAVDFPDEWPDLLDIVYGYMLKGDSRIAMTGGLKLLQDLFDDIISEELFFDKGIGIMTINNCIKLITNDNIEVEIKTLAANLYKSCLGQLQSPDVLDDQSKIQGLTLHFDEITSIMVNLLTEESTFNSVGHLHFRSTLYSISNILITEFPLDLIQLDFITKIQASVINDLIQISQIYVNITVLENDMDLVDEINELCADEVAKNCVIEQYQLLASISGIHEVSEQLHTEFLTTSLEYFGESILASAFLPVETETNYQDDFNLFVTDETGLSPDFTVRNAVYEYLTELNDLEFKQISKWVINKLVDLANSEEKEIDWRSKEALLFVFECLIRHDLDFEELFENSKILAILYKLVELLGENDSVVELLIKSRILIILPHYLAKFKDHISVADFGIKTLKDSIAIVESTSSPLLKAALLISLSNYDSILDFSNYKREEIGGQLQTSIYRIITELLPGSTEDTPSLLADVLTPTLKLHGHSIEALNLLIAIVSKDPANVQLIVDIEESMEALLLDISSEQYNNYLSSVLPLILDTVEREGLSNNGEYGINLNLSLQILNIFISAIPESSQDQAISRQQFDLVFNTISQLILISKDDQILQISGDIYNSLLSKIQQDQWFNLQAVLEVLSKFFKPELSDDAILNVGSLVVSTLSKFQNSSQSIPNDVLTQILEATTKRLLITDNVQTIESFLNVLCFMISIDVEQTLQFLQQFEILQQILNTWFKNFDILRGHERIKLNCESIMKIYLFGGDFITAVEVDGDELQNDTNGLIITRSMRRSMKYEQVPVALKIIKILVTELISQIHANEENENVVTTGHNDNDDDWEDLEDIGDDFDKLKSYIDTDDDEESKSDELKDLLVNFFKEVAKNDTLGFKQIYQDNLTDHERQVLTENIV